MSNEIIIVPTTYKELSDGMLSKLKSFEYIKITEEEMDEIIFDYIKPAIVKFKTCKQNLKDRDDINRTFNIELTDEESEILVLFMLIEYLSATYINVPTLLKQSLSSKDFNVFSGANHLDKLILLRDTYKREARQLASVYSHYESDLFNKLKPTETEPKVVPEEG